NFKMVFVGKGSGDLDYERQLIRQMEKMTSVKFEFLEKQSQEAIFELYKRASAVVMTPLSDGSPVSAMEAMVCQRPLILGPLDYDQDLFSDNVLQIERWDSKELSAMIQKA